MIPPRRVTDPTGRNFVDASERTPEQIAARIEWLRIKAEAAKAEAAQRLRDAQRHAEAQERENEKGRLGKKFTFSGRNP